MRGLAIVAVVVLILLVALVPLAHRRHSGIEALDACLDNEQNISNALQQYGADNRGFFPPHLAGLVPKYLKSIPTCPAAGADTYSASYGSWHPRQGMQPGTFTFFCSGRHHLDAGVGENLPICTLVNGVRRER